MEGSQKRAGWSAQNWAADLHNLVQLALRMVVGELAADAHGEGRKIRTSDLMHVAHPLWLAELCPREMERVNGVAPSSRPWHGCILLLNHTREWCPQPGSHRQPGA
jgi:hypothetical protein